MKRVALFGMGYVGCVTAASLSRDGHQVVGVDVDPAKVDEVNSGRAPISEPGLGELVEQQVARGALRATTDVEEAVRGCEMALIAVGTPTGSDGAPCTAGVERVVDSIGRILVKTNQACTVVVRSTVLPGVLEERLTPILEDAADRCVGDDLHLCNNPEFLREASALTDYDHPPMVLVGANHPLAAQHVCDLYATVVAERAVTDTRTAALVKYACNAFHAMKIAFANEIGVLAKSLGADGQQVMGLLCRDRKLNISPAYLRPGFAFGGSCLPKDLRALVSYMEQHRLRLPVLPSILASNEAHIRRAVQLIERSGHRKIGLVGLSFKAGTDDLRESPQVILAETLLGRGYDLCIYDPCVLTSRLRGRNLAYVDRHLPHLARLLTPEAPELLEHASLLVLGSDVAEVVPWSSCFAGAVIDLRKDLAAPAPSIAAEGAATEEVVLAGSSFAF